MCTECLQMWLCLAANHLGYTDVHQATYDIYLLGITVCAAFTKMLPNRLPVW